MYQEAPSRLVVGISTATGFQEIVTMNLKTFQGTILLQLIDHCTRLSVSVFNPNKKPDTIIISISEVWISVYGAQDKFLSGNHTEFVTQLSTPKQSSD